MFRERTPKEWHSIYQSSNMYAGEGDALVAAEKLSADAFCGSGMMETFMVQQPLLVKGMIRS